MYSLYVLIFVVVRKGSGHVYVLCVSILPVCMILRLYFGTVLTMWYFSFFLLCLFLSNKVKTKEIV